MSLVDLIMPKLGESIMEATILKWHKKAGDKVAQDETILDIATDKVILKRLKKNYMLMMP